MPLYSISYSILPSIVPSVAYVKMRQERIERIMYNITLDDNIQNALDDLFKEKIMETIDKSGNKTPEKDSINIIQVCKIV